MKFTLLVIVFFFSENVRSQTLGGNSVFNFLRLPNTPQLTALGGINASSISRDVGMAFHNPALLNEQMHRQVNAAFTRFYSKSNFYHLSFGYRHEKLKTNFGFGINHFDYGLVIQTDAIGNIYGELRPSDAVVQLFASREYLEKWSYGASIKFIISNYGDYRSSGMAVDVGVLYHDSSQLISASLVVKNAGFQLKAYDGGSPDDLPFDLQAGITKKLKNAPLAFSITAHRLHQFDIRYNDTAFNNENGIGNRRKKFTFDNLFRHFVLAAQLYPVPQLELSLGYNHLRRQELNITNTANGLNGFSIGLGLVLKKLQVRYARSHYQNNTGFNQVGMGFEL